MVIARTQALFQAAWANRQRCTPICHARRDKWPFLGENPRMSSSRPLPPPLPLPFDCRAVLDATMDAIIVHDEAGRIMHVNQCACAIYGYARDEFAALTPEKLSKGTPPYSVVEASEHSQTALRSGFDEFIWHSRRKNGDLFWSEVTLRRHNEADCTFIIAIIRDITERKRIMDALCESEEKLSKIFHGSSNAIALTDLESGRLVDVNKTWVATTGISRETALGKTAPALGLWLDAAQRSACDLELRQTGHARQREITLTTTHGPRPTLLTAETLTLSGGTCVLWELCDVSELRRSEATAREREDRLRMISENFDSGMIYQLVATKDGQRRFTYVSDSVRRLYGASPEEVLADPSLVFSRHHPDDQKALRQKEEHAFDTLTTFRSQLRALEPSGQLRWSSVVATPKPQPDGTVIWDGIEFIITDLKRAEEERASLERQLQHAQRMESVGRLAGGVAHDFNNMLGVVLGHLELAEMALPEGHTVRSNLSDIEKAAERAKDLTSQLLAFARKQAIAPRVLNVNDKVATTLKILQRLIGENIRVVWRPGHDLWTVKMDASQLDQILTNLCVNARDAIAGQGTVTIEATNTTVGDANVTTHPDLTPGDYVCLAVTDDGCGMDPTTQMHVFEPFFTTKGLGVGTGLGLSTVYGIVRQNGGDISVVSEPGNGSTFVVHLPRYLGAEAPAATNDAVHRPRSGTETILVVEDEPSLLRMLTTLLGQSGYVVLPAASPQLAIELAARHADAIRLLISDVIMPGMNGRELAQTLKGSLPGVPQLFMSGYAAHVLDDQLASGKHIGFLQKPFSATELTNMVRELIDGADAD
jgi:two-component system, cell cycle sensor histidine kinase and response regulator CckA